MISPAYSVSRWDVKFNLIGAASEWLKPGIGPVVISLPSHELIILPWSAQRGALPTDMA